MIGSVSYRDRGVLFERARELELEIARHLVRAPELPVDIPSFEMRLLGVYADENGVGLSIGREKRLGTLYYRAPQRGEDGALPSVEAWPPRGGHLSVQERTRLERMRSRLRGALAHVDWPVVWELADELRRSPALVPLQFFRQLVDGVTPRQGLVRTGFRCNQDCGFCWQGRDWPTFDADQILTWIEDLHAAGAERLIVSGGEPTIDKDLFRYLERATALGMRVTLETNAIRMTRDGFIARLERAAPGFGAFVSLHSADAEVSDRATRAPGTHARTLRGIEALLAAGASVKLNAVVTAVTVDTLPALVELAHERFSPSPSFEGLMISLPQTPFDESLDAALRASPEATRAALARTIERAMTLGVRLDGLAGPCGPPLCAFGADPRVTDLRPIPETVDFRTYLPACDACSVRRSCFGAHRSDVEVFGERCAVAIGQE